MDANREPFGPAICVIGFHHSRGPEVESWFGVPENTDPSVDNDWSFLPFMALSDGAHSFEEDFSYFTLRRKLSGEERASSTAHPHLSLFGMSCTRQLDAKELIDRPDDVTRSTVQKSLVIVTEKPWMFPTWREKLSLVTRAWFLQRDFRDIEILKDFQQSLKIHEPETLSSREQFLGLSLREFVYEFKHQALVLFKCALLQPKMLFFGSKCDRLCMLQFALISLIPGLIQHLEDCADPELDSYERNLSPPSSLKTSDRSSLLLYMGLPLQIFGKGALFGPYTPLQQLDILADHGTKSYIVGSTNSLLLHQKERYSDIIVNLDDITISIITPSLKTALTLTAADRRWADFIYQKIVSTWDSANPSRPTTHGYIASDEFIRLQFEEYLLALLSATKYHLYLQRVPAHNRDLSALVGVEGDPTLDFGEVWLESWKASPNFKLWHRNTDSHLFDIVDPRHPTAGSLSLDDINRRVAQQIEDLHLEERFNSSKEVLNKHFTSGKKQVSEVLSKAWADFEAYRASQRTKSPSPTGLREKEDRYSIPSAPATAPLSSFRDPPLNRSPAYFSPVSNSSTTTQTPTSATAFLDSSSIRARAPDLSSAQAAVGVASQKAGAYFSSWGSWASEKRKGWSSPTSTPTSGAFATASTNQSQENKKMTRSPRKLMIVERMRHEDSLTGNSGPRSAPAAASTYNDFRQSMTQDSSDKPTNPATNPRSTNVPTSTPRPTAETVDSNSTSPPPNTQQEHTDPSTPVATEPRSPTKRGLGRGKRREEKGSDGIGRLDA